MDITGQRSLVSARDSFVASPFSVWLVDPSLYTAPYDAALNGGLVAAGVMPKWATREPRDGDRREIPAAHVDEFFYRGVDAAKLSGWKLAAKGFSHFAGLGRLIMRVWRDRPSVVHFQWAVVPQADALAILIIKRFCPVLLTVHDTVPFNGEHLSWSQNFGIGLPIRWANHVIVHTETGRQNLQRRGISPDRITVIPHGPLKPPRPIAPPRDLASDAKACWTFVLFGEIKPYKGLDILVEAVARLPEHLRHKLRVIVAGRPRMDMSEVIARMAELGIADCFDLRLQRQTDDEMADLFESADCFVFPYRQIDASGVYFLVKSLGRWLIASKVGVFAEDLRHGIDGALVASGDVDALASEIRNAVEQRPRSPFAAVDDSWLSIGRETRSLYERARRAHDA